MGRTTIMLRNLPPQFTRAHVIELLEDEGFEGSYDLVYVPMDFSGKCCLGYGFVNFKEASDANRAWEAFDGVCSWDSAEQTACEVVWSDPHQGLEALVERYRNSPVMHESVPEEWKPAYFVDGAQTMFPAPTEKVKAPKAKECTQHSKEGTPMITMWRPAISARPEHQFSISLILILTRILFLACSIDYDS